jgi:DtxR family transcriptional regulator, Mn-dependent transcriptional regulator
MASSTVEDYLKQIYLEHERSAQKWVPMGRLAEAMAVVPGTVTSMVQSLADSGLVDYRPRGGVRLTHAGEKLALHVLRRHRLLELFLVKALELDWAEVHVEAEQLEHAVSDKVLERIDRTLGYPQFDPHGDPIPPAHGRLTTDHQLLPLAQCRPGQRVHIARVLDQAPAFLGFIRDHGLTPGTTVRIVERDAAADSLQLLKADGTAITLGTAAALKILTRSGRKRPEREIRNPNAK